MTLSTLERSIMSALGGITTGTTELTRRILQYYNEVGRYSPSSLYGCRDPWKNTVEFNGKTLVPGTAYEDLTLAAPTWTGLDYPINVVTPLDLVTLENCAVMQGQVWLGRKYRSKRVRFTRCTFRGCSKEHAVYDNVAGYNGGISTTVPSLVWDRCLFEDIGSQAVQLVQRAEEQGTDFQALGDLTAGGEIQVLDCLLRNVGFNRGGNGRAAFALSFFESLNDVKVLRTTLDNSCQALSVGAIMADGHEEVLVSGCSFVQGTTDRPVGLFERVGLLTLQGSHFYAAGGQQTLKINDCDQVVISGCTGNVDVIVDGVNLGNIGDLGLGMNIVRPPGVEPLPREVGDYCESAFVGEDPQEIPRPW